MRIRFVGIDPDTNGNHCPAVAVDEETGDLVLQGWTVNHAADLHQMGRHSPLAHDESIIRIPARMREIILEALNGEGPHVR